MQPPVAFRDPLHSFHNRGFENQILRMVRVAEKFNAPSEKGKFNKKYQGNIGPKRVYCVLLHALQRIAILDHPPWNPN